MENTFPQMPAFPQIDDPGGLVQNSFFNNSCDGTCIHNDDFYIQAIDFEKLAKDLDGSKYGSPFNDQKFDYETYVSNNTTTIEDEGGGKIEYAIDKKLMYINSEGKEAYMYLHGELNKVKCCINAVPAYRIKISSDFISYGLSFHYKDIEQFETFSTTTSYGRDYVIDNKYVAIKISTFNIEDFFAFLRKINRESLIEAAQNIIFRKFEIAFNNAKSESDLNFLYHRAPDFVVKRRGDDRLWEDLQRLLKYDKSSWFKDASRALVNIVKGFADLKKMYQTLEKDPGLVLGLYDFINGKQEGVYCTLLDFLSKLFASSERLKTSSLKIPYGEGYTLDSDLFGGPKGKIRLKSIKTEPIGPRIMTSSGTYFENKVQSVVFEKDDLHPLDIVQLHNVATGETQLVPAIYIKYLSDQEEWAKIIELIMISLDIISILVSAGTIAAGARGLIYVIAAADIGLATTDLLLKVDDIKSLLSKTKAGEWFVEHWDKIYGVAGMLMLTPLVANGIIKNGPTLINFLRRQGVQKAKEFAEAIKNLILNIQVELYIASYSKVVLCSFEPFTSVAQVLGSYFAKSMEEVGLLLGKLPEGDIRPLVYNGVVIAEGEIKDLRQTLKNIFKRKGDELVKYLDSLAEIGVIKFSKRAEEHLKHGHIRIAIVDGSVPKKLPDGSPNPAHTIEKYEYRPGKGRSKSSINRRHTPRVDATSGAHVLKNLNNKYIRIFENLEIRKLPTGETVRIAKIQYWIEELGQWMTKDGFHAFWPQSWSADKIKKVIFEAAENIAYKSGNQFVGKTSNGITIEFYVNKATKEIETAFITFKSLK